jgi:hypothetical protein
MDEEALEQTTVAEAEEAADPATGSEAAERPRGRRRSRWRRALAWAGWSLVLLVALTVLFFTQTVRGQRIVMDEVLERVRGALAGELVVEGVRSGTLLFGLTLEGVRLHAEGGRPFLEADSVVVRYSPLSLAIGSPRLRSTTFYGLRAEISRYPGDDFTNVERILQRGSDDGPPEVAQTIGLGRVAVRGGTLQVLTPTEDAPDELTVMGPHGGRLRRMRFEDLDLDIERTVFRSEGPVTVDARLASLSVSVLVLEEPLVIHEAQGALTFGDRGLRITEAQIRLPGSFLEGGAGFGPDRPGDPWTFAADFRSDDWSDLGDVAWVDPRIPEGTFRGGASVRIADGIEVGLREVDVRSAGSVLTLDGDTRFAEAMSMRSLRVTAEPVVLASLDPWLEAELPLRGRLRGNATLGGTLAALTATGRMTFTPDSFPEAVTTVDFSGTVHTGANPGGSGLELRLEPFDYRVLEPFWPEARRLGTGRAALFVEGRANEGLRIVADVTHRSDAVTTSRVVGRGTLRRGPDRAWIMDVRGELAPLSLPLLGRIWPQIDVPGTVSGPVQADGRITALRVSGDLTSEAGRLVFDATADMTAPAAGYAIDADAEALDLAAFTSRVPSPSVFSGRVAAVGSGFSADSLSGSASVALRSARIGDLTIDSASAMLEASDGVITADSLRASVAGVRIEGSGSVGMTAEREGRAALSFSAETLLGFRPVFMGDSILVADTLNALELDVLRARGIDPDTLPTADDVRMAGVLSGTADVQGWFGDLDVDLLFDLTEAAYGHNSVDSARVSLAASGLPETLGEWDVDVGARGIVFANRVFEQVGFVGTMVQQRGEGTLDVERRPQETYHLAGAFALDSLGGELELTGADIRVNDMSWLLERPTTMVWSRSTLRVDSLEVRRSGPDPMLVAASGTLTRGGDSDFHMVMEGFHVEQALRIAQREDIELSGHIDLELDVEGPAERPVITARFDVQEPRYGDFELTRVDGSLEYQDRAADFVLEAWHGERRVLTGQGRVPLNLALAEVESRTVEEQMDITLRADSLDAAVPFVYLSALEDVTGTITAEMRIRGTPSRPEPSGRVFLANAAWTIEALGVRHTGVSGELLLQPNGTVAISLASTGTSQGSGTSTVSGVVRLDPATDPTLDLTVAFDRFLAVDRRDMRGTITGELRLTGRYQQPVTQGSLRMEEATLFVEEFVRNVGVVDLRNPITYAPGMAVDTTVFVSQPVIAGLSNPFLDNLRVDVDLAVPRNLWLRSSDMNVEMGGDLIVRYDRREGDLVLVGELQALRGSYVVLGRTFEVDGGTASFLGQPGVNPTLDIQALTRVRRREGERLEVRASVQGTLVEPVVTLSTEEAGLSQSDLISYLVFGRSSAEVGSAGLQNLETGGLTYAAGTVVNQLGSVLAQEIPGLNRLDYLSFSQAQAIGGTGSYVGTALAGTQVEAGLYLNDNVFVIFVLGGAQSEGDSGTSFELRGVRIELAVLEQLFVEFFVEDRFIRTGSALGASELADDDVVGIFMFSEWGYGSRQQDQQ